MVNIVGCVWCNERFDSIKKYAEHIRVCALKPLLRIPCKHISTDIISVHKKYVATIQVCNSCHVVLSNTTEGEVAGQARVLTEEEKRSLA